jgi:flagellar biosynthetic protein FliQ
MACVRARPVSFPRKRESALRQARRRLPAFAAATAVRAAQSAIRIQQSAIRGPPVNPQSVITLGQQALYVMLMIASPMLVAALVVGLIVSILQAATQINEMTLSFIPKLVAILAALVIAGPWIITYYVDYVRRLFESIPTAIG